MGYGKGKGKPRTQRTTEEVQHAKAVNQRRDAASLPKKSTGSVSRSKARSAAYHALSNAVPAEDIAEPRVKPPPPPPSRRTEPIRLVEREEVLSRNPKQPGTSSKGSAPGPAEHSSQGGELLPQDKQSPKKRDHEGRQHRGHKMHKRGEILPQEDRPAASSGPQLLPQDAQELDTSSSEEAASSGVVPSHSQPAAREDNANSLASQHLMLLHGRVTCRGVPRDVLRSIPPQLGSEWGGIDQGPSGVLLEYVARGSDKLAYESEGFILKLSECSLKAELAFSKQLPTVVATTFWTEKIRVLLHQDDGSVWHNYSLFLSCQEKTVRAASLMEARGEVWAFRFLAYIGCILVWLTARGVALKDVGTSNLGIRQATAACQQPTAVFYDTLSWSLVAKPSFRWSGWLSCIDKYCPAHAQWLKGAVIGASSHPALTFSKLLVECQQYADVLTNQGALVGGVMTEPVPITFE